MKKSICILLLFSFSALLVSQNLLLAHEIKVQRYTLALLPLRAGARVSEMDALRLTRQLHRDLSSYQIFNTLDMARVIRSLQSGKIDPANCTSVACAVEAGRILGARLVANGEVKQVGPLFFINVQIVHVGSGQVVQTVQDEFEGDLEAFQRYMRTVAEKLVGVPAPEAKSLGASSEAEPVSEPQQGAMNTDELLFPMQNEPESETIPAQETQSLQKPGGGKKWALIGLLVAGGIGAGVLLSQKSSKKDSDSKGETKPLTVLPTPPSFP